MGWLRGVRVCGGVWRDLGGVVLVLVLFGSVLGAPVSGQVEAPAASGTPDRQEVTVGSTIDVDVAGWFTGSVDSYTVSVRDESIATASVSGSVVSLTGVAASSTVVTVTATNSAGSASQGFFVGVSAPPPPPSVTWDLPSERSLDPGGYMGVDLDLVFSGGVTGWDATSSDEAVVRVSLDGSRVTVTGVAGGSATVTFTATNANGSTSQSITFTVTGPPPTTTTTTMAVAAPTVAATLAAQTVAAGATSDVDVAAGFAGTVDSYSAVSSDTTKLTVSVAGSVVTLTGVAVGSPTVTVTATNTGGEVSQTFTVTVAAPPAPTVAATLAARTVTAGATSDVDVAAGFAGIVDSYSATSGDTTKLTVAVDGSVVTLTGVAAGETTVTVTATNTTASVSQTVTVTVTELSLAATAPAYCLTGEGRPVLITPAADSAATVSTGGTTTTSTVGREGVAAIDVSYTITGGRGPYTVTSPAATTTTGGASDDSSSANTGALSVSCALADVNLNDVDASTNVVEAGPKTITLQLTDADGATDTTEITIQIAEDAYTSGYNDGTMRAGRTYILGTSEQWALITLPTGLDLRFERVSEVDGEFELGYFVDTISGSLIVLDWGAGTEVHREIKTSDAPGPSSRSTTTSRDVAALFDALVASTSAPLGHEYDGGTLATHPHVWRPYEGLPSNTRVMMHESMLKGDSLTVCNAATAEDFDLEDFGMGEFIGTAQEAEKRGELLRRFNGAFIAAVDLWNAALYRENDTDGTPHKVFNRVPRAVTVMRPTNCHPRIQVWTSLCTNESITTRPSVPY